MTGASGGIGAACARAFAAEGARVVVHYHRGEERARSLADELGGAPIVRADLTVEADVDRLFASARDGRRPARRLRGRGGRLSRRGRPGLGARPGALRADARAQPHRDVPHGAGVPPRGPRDASAGALVLVGSTAGRFGEAGHADYAAAKAAIQGGLLLSLKNEAARLGPRVRVNAVAPGWTVSPMTRGMLADEDVRRITRTMPLRKVATPEDVAAQVVVLASERLSGHVTGELVTVAGGMEGRVLHDEG